MKLLIVGSGGREHAIAWRLSRTPGREIVCAPGNPGMATLARCVPVRIDDLEGLVALARKERPDLVIIGPEGPLVAGLADILQKDGLAVFGPSAEAARLEGSKGFSKDFMARHGVPTATYGRFRESTAAKAFLRGLQPPYVLKADGLAAGKGVIIVDDLRDAEVEIDAMLSGRFGAASAELVIEEFMPGEEASFFALCDGATAIPFGGAQDHKRVGEGDTGPNTGGMGAYSPAPILTPQMEQQVMDDIVRPTLRGMASEGAPYRGVLFVGLMIANGTPRVVEFNCRFGDPECQTLMARLAADPLEAFLACASGSLAGIAPVPFAAQSAMTVVLAARGYPGAPTTGGAITGLDRAAGVPGVAVFHAGSALANGRLVAAGGRVLNVTAVGDSLRQAAERAYTAIDQIEWTDGFCRRDIGWRALAER
jgi:phosphoribosylamine---glycine ligase